MGAAEKSSLIGGEMSQEYIEYSDRAFASSAPVGGIDTYRSIVHSDELVAEPSSGIHIGTERILPTDHHSFDVQHTDSLFQVSKSSLETVPSYAADSVGQEDNDAVEYNNDNDEYDDDDDLKDDVPVEDSWQYLGELPYRRIVIYDKVQWGTTPDIPPSTTITSLLCTPLASSSPSPIRLQASTHKTNGSKNNNKAFYTKGLVCIPRAALPKQSSSSSRPFYNNNTSNRQSSSSNAAQLDPTEYHQYVSTTTITHVAVCPCGGPMATLTVAISNSNSRLNSNSSSFPIQQQQQQQQSSVPHYSSLAELRIMTQSGKLLSSFSFPPKHSGILFPSSSEIFSMGFTSSYILVILFRDSTCWTCDVSGQVVLSPFTLFPPTGTSFEILQAHFYDQGVAVLTAGMSCAMVEILNEDLDKEYGKSPRPLTTRRIDSSSNATTGQPTTASHMFALITTLPTAAYAASHFITYPTLAVLPRMHTSTRHPEIFLSTSDHSILICDAYSGSLTDVHCQSSFSSPIVLMSFAPNGRFIACFSQNCILSVLSTSFETKVLDFDTSEGSPNAPRDMKWCGEDSVVLYWKNLGVLMVGPYGDWLRFPITTKGGTDHVYIFSEVDCCRVITDDGVEILQRVPPVTVQLLSIASSDPGALLLYASDDFEKGIPSSDESARAITKNEEAIESCCQAAACELDIQLQKRLLTAASYGMHFTCRDANWKDEIMGGDVRGRLLQPAHGKMIKPSSVAIQFVNTARKIRVMNALRDVSIGFVITSAQYDLITPSGIVARLIAMKRPAMATSICRYLQLDTFVHAACRAARASAFVSVDKDHTDADTAERAIKILNEGLEVDLFTGSEATYLNRGCFAAVAIAANKAGRPGVAHLLLIMELNIEDKVNALLQLGSFSDAAAVAVQAKDADLLFKSLIEYEKSCLLSNAEQSKAESIFLSSVVSKFPSEAVNLLTYYYSYLDDVKYVMNALLKSQKYVSAGTVMAKKALERSKGRDRAMLLQEASRIYGLSRDAGFQKTIADEHLELLAEQEKIVALYSDLAIKNASVSITIYNILCYAGIKPRESSKLLAEAERLGKKFKVSEKRLWHLKVEAFGESEQWTALWSLAESKTKPPIGFKYFALEGIKRRQSEETIMKYIDKITETEERYELLCEGKFWKRAIDEVMKLGDKGRLIHIRSVCGSPVIQQLCDELL